MRRPVYTRQFERDVKRMKKRGNDLAKLKDVITRLLSGEPLPPKLRDHKLLGNYVGRRDCHIESDWVLIYKPLAEEVIFERTGTHSDLFE
jgi:mRNA interferase YafQ